MIDHQNSSCVRYQVWDWVYEQTGSEVYNQVSKLVDWQISDYIYIQIYNQIEEIRSNTLNQMSQDVSK